MKEIFQQQQSIFTVDMILTVRTVSREVANTIFSELWQKIRDFDQRFSRFIPSSELAHLNEEPGKRVAISSEMAHFLQKSIEMGKLTNGLFNPFVLPALQRAGYVGSLPNPTSITNTLNYTKRSTSQLDQIKIGDDWVVLPPKSAFDSGGLGKGYLLDCLGEITEKHGITDYWFSLGGDLLCSGELRDGHGWVVGVESANSVEGDVSFIDTLGKKVAIATSGITKRKGTNWHHLIDPATGLPAETDILTATVVTENGVTADAFAKSLIILGSQKALDAKFGIKPYTPALDISGHWRYNNTICH